MRCVDCGGTLGLAHPSAAVRISPAGSVGICAGCVPRYGPGVALDLRLDEAIEAQHADRPRAEWEVRVG